VADLGIPLTVRFDARSRETQNVTSWMIDSSYLTSTDEFSFQLFSKFPEDLEGLELQPVTLKLGETVQLIGRITGSRVGGNGANVRDFRGLDYISEIVECNVDPLVKITSGMALQAAVKHVCSPCGIEVVLGDAAVMRKLRSGVSTITRKAPKDFRELKLEDIKPEAGEGIYEFLNPIVARHGCTIQPGTARNELMLEAPQFEQDPVASLQRAIDGSSNNVMRAEADRDWSRYPSFVMVTGLEYGKDTQKGPRRGLKTLDTIEETGKIPEIDRIVGGTVGIGRRKPDKPIGDPGFLYRLLRLKDDKARNQAQLEAAAQRMLAERTKDTLEYTATLRGHRDPKSGAIWTVGTMVRVDDEVARVHEALWISKRKLSYSPTGGATTEITCWRPGTFVIDPQ
jgi:prophage tail gpP-like protein